MDRYNHFLDVLFSYYFSMVDTDEFLEQYRIYKNILEDPKDKDDDERQEEIEKIMDEYWVDEDEAEEILDSE